jgi:hypothetical protein
MLTKDPLLVDDHDYAGRLGIGIGLLFRLLRFSYLLVRFECLCKVHKNSPRTCKEFVADV